MTTGTKVILTVILFGGIGTIVFLKIKQGKEGTKKPDGSTTPPSSQATTPSTTTSATAATTPAKPLVSTPAPDPRVGKIANAKYANTPVYNKDGSLYKTAMQGEWIGTVSSVSNGKIFVEGDIRYVFDTTVPSITTNFTGKTKK